MPKLIKQDDLRAVVAQRELVAGLKRQLADEASELDKRELLLVHAVTLGVRVEPGILACGITQQPGQRRPAWKEEFARVAGPAAIDDVIDRTEPGPTKDVLVIVQAKRP